MKWPKRKRDWEGLRVRLIADAHTSVLTIPSGTEMKINYSSGAGSVELLGKPCVHCGVRARLRLRCTAKNPPNVHLIEEGS